MNQNFDIQIEEETQYFVDKFLAIGWKCEDGTFFSKKTDFIVNPSARNHDSKHSIGIIFSQNFLSYYKRDGEKSGYVKEIWIKGIVRIEENKEVKYPEECPRLQQVVKFLKEEFKKADIKPFYDEDAFMGNFTKPEVKKNLGQVSISFYVNKDYPKGWWANHTL